MLGIEGISPRLVDRYSGALLQAITRGLKLPEDELPAFPRGERRTKDPEADKRLLQLKEWRKEAAIELELDAGVLINNATLEELARRNPQSVDELAEMSTLKNWQQKVLGKGIINRLKG